MPMLKEAIPTTAPWVCPKCGHQWIARHIPPTQCPRRECRYYRP